MESMTDIILRQERLKISMSILAKVAGMSSPQLSKLVNRHKTPREDTMMRLSAALTTIEQNNNAIKKGIIILNEVDFKKSLSNAMGPELISREGRGINSGDATHIIDMLVKNIFEYITKLEE